MSQSNSHLNGQREIDLSRSGVFERMPRVCAWNEMNQTLDEIQTSYLLLRRRGAYTAFEKLEPPESDQLKRTLEALPESAARRFLMAPETGNRLSLDREQIVQNVPFFQTALRAEQALTGIDNPTEECWSALGDFCFRREEHRPARAYYEAPCVGGMIPVDYFSPYARFVDTMSNCAFEQYTDVERQDLFVKFEQAFESMMLASACASRFVAKLVRVVIPRKSSLRGDRCGSSSSRLHIGRVIFPNGHIMDGEGLADGLIHEAIHGALNTLEALGYVENPSSASLRFRSPWSGNDLSVRTYLHACFVWYGLVYFWHFAMCRDTSPSTRVCELASRAIKGFRHGNPIDPLLPHAGPISRVWLEVAGSLHSELRDNGLLN